MHTILNGRLLATQIQEGLHSQIAERLNQGSRAPGLCTILLGGDPASEVYVRNKVKLAHSLGIQSFAHTLPSQTSKADLLKLIEEANQNSEIDGILVQLPLPAHIQTEAVLRAIDPLKDVDGFHPENVGFLSIGNPRFIPCTPLGVLTLLRSAGLDLKGKHAVIVGRSNIVGKPMAQLLLNEEATVTICHKQTCDLKSVTRQADILISAAGVPHLVTEDFVQAGTVVIDVGITRLPSGKLAGDVDFEAVLPKVKAITPVPGGIGPMTLAMLMQNTWQSYQTTGTARSLS